MSDFNYGGTDEESTEIKKLNNAVVFERGVASIATSVDLWTDYCSFKVETCHESEVIRE
ncbi:putative Pre-mRNA-processing factor 39 [Glarea lozoyensis 74030]|uniref:Putative Pre-mRNA-processing factor 39 n=1 Tax=Glarea lozoyensis (strain ATCC 74030 / MF5533) TaxID=1104152 RepID=H0EE19_GLAL7|nr:putative Pre-mRNA-processing factor 39 [Glarea lozoyensis 74030]